MYPFEMERKKLKNILLQYYIDSASNHILRGIRKPSYENMLSMYKEHQIPFTAWEDIKSYISNDTKQDSKKPTTAPQERVPA